MTRECADSIKLRARRSGGVLLLTGLLLFLNSTPSTYSAMGTAGGVFEDRAGNRHSWEVNRAHALIWEGKPYLPAGVLLHVGEGEGSPPPVAGAQEGATAALPAAVSTALELVTARGLKDVCLVRPGGWLQGPAAADQALVDALEARGLRYGVALDARPARPLSGFHVVPTRIEVPAERRPPGARLKWSVPLPGARAALYLLVDRDSDSVISAGRVPVVDNQAPIEIALRPGRRLFSPGPARLIVVAERELAPDAGEGPIDFWSGWQDVQRALVERLSATRWGPGLRFFARPVATEFGLRGEVEELVPSSGGWRLQMESWLERRHSLADLSNRWALNDRSLPSMAVAARLVPFWGREAQGEKSAWMLDPVSFDWYRVDLRRSSFWRDFDQFRADSIRRVVGQTATLIKKRAADVPVVWEWTEHHPVFSNPAEAGGLDGLAFAALGRGREAAISSAAYAYAQAEESTRPTWFLQLGQRWEADGPPTSAEEQRLDWNWLREIGCKGFFLDGLGAGGGETAAPGMPEQLEWVRQYGEQLVSSLAAAEYRPPVLLFPTQLLGTSLTGRLSNGVWWLPSFAGGSWLALGGEIEGYWIDRALEAAPAGSGRGALVLWSTSGPQKVTFVVPENRPVIVYDSTGRILKQTSRQGRLQVPITTTPVLVTGLPAQNLFPVETAAQAIRELEALVRQAEAQKMDVATSRLALNQAKSIFTPSGAQTAYQLVRTPLAMLRAALTPYIWIEGEAAAGHNWSGVQPEPRASGGSFLRLNRTAAPSSGVYQARFGITVEREATYELWVAGSLPGSEEASPFTWRVDDRSPALAVAGEGGRRYAPGLGWTRLGEVPLSPGRHTLTIATAEAARKGGYRLAIDAVVLAREPFQPDGIRRPDRRLARQDPRQDEHATR